MKYKKIIVTLVLSIAFLAAGWVYIYHSHLKEGLQLVLKVKVSRANTLRLFIGEKLPREKRVRKTEDFQTVRFLLPREKIENLRLTLGGKPGSITIAGITVKNLYRKYLIKGKHLPKIFREFPGTGKNNVKDQYYYLETSPHNLMLIPGDAFNRAVEKLQQQKTSFYLLWVVFSGLFFYILYFLDLRGLKTLIPAPGEWVKALLVFGFVLLIFLPLADPVFHLSKKLPLAEKRSVKPHLEFRPDTLSRFAKKFNYHYNHHFPFRSSLIYMNNLLKVKLLGISPNSGVLMGKDDWLFFDVASPTLDLVDYYRSLSLFTPAELEQWKNMLEQRFRWLEARGINYLFVIAPEKCTIYPEFMPGYIRKVHRESRMDQLVEYLGRHSRVPFLDLRPALIKAKKFYPVYWKTDTHWSSYGAYIAYREIINYISCHFGTFKDAEPVELSRFKIEIEDHVGGDLAEMLGLHQKIIKEKAVFMAPVPPFTAVSGKLEDISRYVRQIYTQCSTAPLPNILMVHDSFYHQLKPFLAEQFVRVLYIWDWGFNFYPEIIRRENPKLVIDEMAERFLMDGVPKNPKSIDSPASSGKG